MLEQIITLTNGERVKVRIEAVVRDDETEPESNTLPWWKNEDGTLKCFGKAWEYSNEGQSFHCLQLSGISTILKAARHPHSLPIL